jgi:glycosyltransferase 2 family protein
LSADHVEAAPRARRRFIGVALKASLTLALAWVLLTRVPLAAAWRALTELGAVGLGVAAGFTALSQIVAAWRWRRILARLGEEVPLGALLGDLLVGGLYNLVLPTSVGGDVLRGLRSARRVKVPEHAWAALLYERVLGLLALAALSAVGLAVTATRATRGLLLAGLLVALVLVSVLVFADLPLRLAARLAGRFSERARAALERLAAAFAGPLASGAARVEIFAWSLGYQLAALALLLGAAVAWREPAVVPLVLFGLPIALVATVLPITLGGFGLREGLFVAVAAPFGVSAERALALGLVWVLSSAAVALAGALVLWSERR